VANSFKYGKGSVGQWLGTGQMLVRRPPVQPLVVLGSPRSLMLYEEDASYDRIQSAS
jgi:hypothetical protein